ncbi:MAG: Smr/MutS family protein, partial [Nitratireductor sp.]
RSYAMPSYSPPVSTPKQTTALNSPIDRPTMRKLAKGRLNIDSRIDLHGLTQLQAHRTLLNFVEDAYRSSYRIVLVITGKGRITEGILRSSVPQWLQQNDFSTYVSGYKTSHSSHGGEGALYVRIRRNKQ